MVPGYFLKNVLRIYFLFFIFETQNFFTPIFYQLPFVFSSPVFMFGNGFGFNPFCIRCLLLPALPPSRWLSLRHMICRLSMWSCPPCATGRMWSTSALFGFPCWL